jgi:diguanylate cyclase (GGDEF)-like protein
MVGGYIFLVKRQKLEKNKKAYIMLLPIILILISDIVVGIDVSNKLLNVFILPILITIFFFQLTNKNYKITKESIIWIFRLFPSGILYNQRYIKRIFDSINNKKTKVILNILIGSIIGIPIAVIILFIGLDLNIIYFSLKKFLKGNKAIIYLGCFSILISIWMAMESTLTQFAAGNSYIISALTYLSLMTVPIPIMLYISNLVNPKFKKLILYLNYFFFFYDFILIFLKFFNLSDFHEGLFILHALMFIIWSIVFTILCLEVFKYKNKEIRYITFSFGFLFLFGFLELINYELKTPISIGTFIEFGILIFMVIITLGSIHKVIAIIKLSDDAKYYEYLATRDYLTKCKNRAAYSKELECINLDHEITIIMADVNDMKTINDTFGHYVGDEVLVKCSQCLSKIFGSLDHCYRIGGDEFVYIENNENVETVKKKAELFLKECETINAECSYSFKISIGFAFYDSKIDEDIYDTVIRADQNMYHLKAVKA